MAVRFRIRTPAGQELSFASRDMFEEFVRSGDLSPDDLVYDGETGSWSPARTHPTFVEIQYGNEAETGRLGTPGQDRQGSNGGRAAAEPSPMHPEAGSDESDPAHVSDRADLDDGPDQHLAEEPDQPLPADPSDGADPGDGSAPAGGQGEPDGGDRDGSKGVARGEEAGDVTSTVDDDDLGLDLAFHEEESAEEAKRKLIAKLEAERESELDGGRSIQESLAGFTVEAGPYGDLIRDPTRPPSGPRPARPRPSGVHRRPSTSPASTGRRSPRTAAGRGPRKKGGGIGRLVFLLLVLSLLAGGAYIGYEILSAGPVEEPPGAVDPDGNPLESQEVGHAPDDPEVGQALDDPPVRLVAVAGTPSADQARDHVSDPDAALVGERARERYLASTQAALRDLPPVPDFWPDASYLVMPTEHPEIVDLWRSYRATIRDVRAGDEERFRVALEAALDEAGLDRQGRERRRGSILDRRAEHAPLRRAHFDRVEALASAALRSHEALVDAEGLLLYDATGGRDVEARMGQGVSGRGADAQLLLDQVVALLTVRLEAGGEGPGSPEKVREWVWDGFLDAATR